MTRADEMRGVVAMMSTMLNEDGEKVFPHLDADCLTAMARSVEANADDFAGMGMLELCTRAYWRTVRTKHPGIN